MRFFIAIVVSLFLSLPALAEPQEDIQAVISQQLEDFKRDDFAAAFDHASDGIRSMFGTSENFGRMVQNGYPMVWRPKAVTFLSLGELGDGYAQDIEIIDQNGVAHYLRYYMIPTQAGWRINGVDMLQGNPMAV